MNERTQALSGDCGVADDSHCGRECVPRRSDLEGMVRRHSGRRAPDALWRIRGRFTGECTGPGNLRIRHFGWWSDRYRDQVLLLPLDVTNEVQAIEAVTSTIRTFGRLDVLVNNAGYGPSTVRRGTLGVPLRH